MHDYNYINFSNRLLCTKFVKYTVIRDSLGITFYNMFDLKSRHNRLWAYMKVYPSNSELIVFVSTQNATIAQKQFAIVGRA